MRKKTKLTTVLAMKVIKVFATKQQEDDHLPPKTTLKSQQLQLLQFYDTFGFGRYIFR